jgi:hypothetical protein
MLSNIYTSVVNRSVQRWQAARGKSIVQKWGNLVVQRFILHHYFPQKPKKER